MWQSLNNMRTDAVVAGCVTCSLDLRKTEAYFGGYLEAYDNHFREYDKVFGLTYTWLEWLEYNVKRALGMCCDAYERDMGITETKNTIARIKYIREREEEIKKVLSQIGK